MKSRASPNSIEIGPDQHIKESATNVNEQVISLKKFMPDLIWHSNSLSSVVVTLKAAHTMGLRSDHIISTRGFGEDLPRLAARVADGAIGCDPRRSFGEKSSTSEFRHPLGTIDVYEYNGQNFSLLERVRLIARWEKLATEKWGMGPARTSNERQELERLKMEIEKEKAVKAQGQTSTID